MTGGTEKLRFRLSAGYIDNNGVLITDKDQYRRMNDKRIHLSQYHEMVYSGSYS